MVQVLSVNVPYRQHSTYVSDTDGLLRCAFAPAERNLECGGHAGKKDIATSAHTLITRTGDGGEARMLKETVTPC